MQIERKEAWTKKEGWALFLCLIDQPLQVI